MTIYGMSQSSGVERRLRVEKGSIGVVLIISDHDGNKERTRILVPADALLASVMDPPADGTTVAGIYPPQGPEMKLTITVRRNEVQFHASRASGEEAEVAVGLDDFQDALEKVVSRG